MSRRDKVVREKGYMQIQFERDAMSVITTHDLTGKKIELVFQDRGWKVQSVDDIPIAMYIPDPPQTAQAIPPALPRTLKRNTKPSSAIPDKSNIMDNEIDSLKLELVKLEVEQVDRDEAMFDLNRRIRRFKHNDAKIDILDSVKRELIKLERKYGLA